MPRTQAISEGDRELLDTLTAAGIPGETTQLERWRGLGFLPSNDRQWLGRKGSASNCTPQAKDQVVPLARLMNGRRPRHVTAFKLFARGYWISEPALRSAYHRWLEDLHKSNRLDGTVEASEGAARAAMNSVGRDPLLRGYKRRLHELDTENRKLDTEKSRLLKLADNNELRKPADRHRLDELGGTPTGPLETPDDRLVHALTDTLHVLSTGEPVGDLADFLDASGISEAFPGQDSPTLTIEEALVGIEVGALHRLIDTTPIDAFEQSRDEALLLRDFADAQTAVVAGLRDAINVGAISVETILNGLPDFRLLSEIAPDDLGAAKLTLWLRMNRQAFGEKPAAWYDVMIEGVRVVLPRYQAQATLLADLPEGMRRFMIETELNDQPPETRAKIEEEIRRTLTAHPDEAALLTYIATHPEEAALLT